MIKAGTIVAGHRIEGVLGEGSGMGLVYRATQLSLDRTVALKFLSRELSGDPQFRERFRREGRLQATINHPHIAAVYEAGETEQGMFISMFVVEGPTLKDLIHARELDASRSLQLLGQVADALDAAHAVGLIHRDVKPQNILIGSSDHAFLADFGLTKSPDVEALTETGQLLGTIDYISPEQARALPATSASDVYALACVLYECLAGQVPFYRPSEPAALFAHIVDPPPRLSARRPDLPVALDEVIVRGLAKAPVERPASAGGLLREAQRALDGGGEAARTGTAG
ncbi:MAG: serine/threonine protein kinase [Thermoleophilaceae bacterium]|nr:serine/threonine protein kinase [Thermoleophilaceae bacterium]